MPPMPMTMPMMPSVRAVVSLDEEDATVLLFLDDASVSAAFWSSAFLASSAAPPWWSSAAAVSFRTGAGLSGSSPPAVGSSIQRTTSLLSYVWIALKTSWSASSGSAPTETGNCWK